MTDDVFDEHGVPRAPVSDREAIGYADGALAAFMGVDGRPVTEWVIATNEARDAARAEWASAPIEVAGVRLEVGRVYDVTTGAQSYYRGKTIRRRAYRGREAMFRLFESRARVEHLRFSGPPSGRSWRSDRGVAVERERVVEIVDVTPKATKP